MGPEGGANDGWQGPGNNDRGGTDLSGWEEGMEGEGEGEGGDVSRRGTGEPPARMRGFQEIAVAPDGRYVLSAASGRLLLGELDSGSVSTVVGVESPGRVAFAHGRSRFYVGSSSAPTLWCVDASRGQIVWTRPRAGRERHVRLYAAPDDATLVVAQRRTVELLDPTTGERRRRLDGREVIDVDFRPGVGELLVTRGHTWSGEVPTTEVTVVSNAGETIRRIGVPNCAAPMVVTPDGRRAFLAPTTCERPAREDREPPAVWDPVSVIDLETRRWLRNLPGFGPATLAPDGTTAVAFMDADNLDLSLFEAGDVVPSSDDGRFHLMLIDTATLSFDSVPPGDELPRYALTPDGHVVLVDAPYAWRDGRVRLLDVPSRSLRRLDGPPVLLEHYTVTPDSADVYLLQQSDLYWISIPALRTVRLTDGAGWRSLNITPDGAHLLLVDREDLLHVYSPSRRRVVRVLRPPSTEVRP